MAERKKAAATPAPTILAQPMKGSDDAGWSVKIGVSPLVGARPGINFEFGVYRTSSGMWVSHMSANGHNQFQVCEAKSRRGAISAIEREFEKLSLAVTLVKAKVGIAARETA